MLEKSRSRAIFRTPAFRDTITAYVFLLPALTLMGVWMVYPLVQAFVVSLQQVNIFNLQERSFVGLEHYRSLFRNLEFMFALRTTLIFVLAVVPIQTLCALLLSNLVNSVNRGRAFFRTSFFVPYITSTVAVTVVFMRLFTRNGVLTMFFQRFGLPNTAWFANVDLALPFLAIVYVWMNLGLHVILFLTGLQSIPDELRLAATVDGATPVQVFWYVTLPLLRPFVFLVITTGVIMAFQVFDQAYAVARGGSLGSPAGATMTLVLFVYAQAFRYNHLGSAGAASVVLLGIVLAVTILLRGMFREKNH